MSECAPSLPALDWRALRVERIVKLRRQRDLVELQFRGEVAALAVDDTEFGYRKYVASELALALAESPAVVDRWLEEAQLFGSSTAVLEQVATGVWSMRQADAVLDEVIALPTEDQQTVIDLVRSDRSARTPYQLRRAARAAALLLDLDAAEKRAQDARDNRRVVTGDHRDGSASLIASGTKAAVAALSAALDAMCLPRQAGDDRTLPQRRFDTLMDLVCGRREPGQWEATVLVSLATLEGGNEPAEIPGLGLITATEARELLADARVRRAVVDENGVLVGVDQRVESPDLPIVEAEPCTVSDAVEPQPVDDADDETTVEELNSYLEWQAQSDLDPAEPEMSEQEAELFAELEAFLTRMAQKGVLAHSGAPFSAEFSEPIGLIEIDLGPPPDHGDRPWPPRTPPPDPDDPDYWSGPEPAPPTESDRDWHDSDVDRDTVYAEIDQQVSPAKQAPVDLAMARARRTSSAWSQPALGKLRHNLLTRTPDQLPTETTAYALPPRMARHIKLRDVTCTFPGCTRLAKLCQNDHVIEYPKGATSCGNTLSECLLHHQGKHAIFTLTRLPDGTARWATKYGLVVDRPPRPLLRGW